MITDIRTILNSNPHWDSKTFSTCQYPYKRNVFLKVLPWLDEKEIISLAGLRRTGKSVLLEQLQNEFCRRHLEDETVRLFRFAFDNEDFPERIPNRELSEILDFYFDSILQIAPANLKNRVLIVLDEIQNIKSWQTVLKYYYDLSPNIKFFISGSSALFLKGDSESLAGRIIEYDVNTLSFAEFLDLTGNAIEINFPTSIDDLLTFRPIRITAKMQSLFEAFLLCGGFPESASKFGRKFSIEDLQSYIRDAVIKKIVSKDLLKFYGVKAPLKDFELFKQLCRETGSIINIKRLAKDVGYSEETLANHLDIFEKSNLCTKLNKFEIKKRRILKSKFKFYINSPSIVMATLGIQHLNDSRFVGHVIETYVYQRLRERLKEVYFVQNEDGKEIDFIDPENKIIIESKYGELRQEEFKFFINAAMQYRYKKLVITKNTWNNKDLPSIPVMLL